MSKILVFNVPAYGHVNPTLPVVCELVSRGEQVAYYLTDEFEPQIRHTGAEFRRIEDTQLGSGPPPGMNAMGRTDPAKVRCTSRWAPSSTRIPSSSMPSPIASGKWCCR